MKKILCLLLVGILSFGMVSFAANEPSDWAKEEIDQEMVSLLESLDVDVNFQRDITRQEFCYLALEAYSRLSGGKFPELKEVINPFTDMNDSFVLIAYGLGIVKGKSDTTFEPNAPITRQEMCLMLTRVLSGTLEEYKDGTAFGNEAGAIDGFADKDSVANWALQAVEFSVSKGIMKGVSDTEIGPLGNCTMEQAIILVARMANSFAK